MVISSIVSGAQTGVDRAALDVALELQIPCGGWVPKGRLDEQGIILSKYPNLRETESTEPNVRTELNVRDSDATLILTQGELIGGSKYTAQKAIELQRPLLHLDLKTRSDNAAVREIMVWLEEVKPRVLNIAGPRHSEDKTIYSRAKSILTNTLFLQSCDSLQTCSKGMDEDTSIALSLREAALADYRHWDIIRWQVPYWYCTLATAVAAGAVFAGDIKYNMAVRVGCGVLAIFGVLCIVLLANLVRYDVNTIKDYHSSLKNLRLSDTKKEALRIKRRFSFSFPGILTTASLWFIIYILLLTSGFFWTVIMGMWWM
ncbi:hypothetical protein HGB07_08540 [Candidatus Roizmanbacteria bacterium]|nr:hypothetical protein [Candidatus Roizmanbacteria bacterium]